MSRPVSLLLVGIGGYGNTYVDALLGASDRTAFRIVGIADPYPEGCRRLADLKAMNIPFYTTPAEFYARSTADLAVISAPIAFHAEYTCLALRNGSHVLCEKPLAATIRQARAMREARDAAGRFAAIGYQWSFSDAIQALKHDILAGLFGRPKRLRTLVLWPRNAAYYNRNDWAGALKDRDGRWVLDSPVNNATAHYLHNMFYVLGQAVDAGSAPVSVQAELYRANAITNYDTGVCRVQTECGAEILFYSTHAVNVQRGPEFIYEFENGVVTYPNEGGTIQAAFVDGSSKNYGNPNRNIMKKLWDALAAVRGSATVLCGIEAASSQTLCMNAMQDSCATIQEFPPELIRTQGEGGQRVTYVDGLAETLAACYDRGILPSELGAAWARPGRIIDVTY